MVTKENLISIKANLGGYTEITLDESNNFTTDAYISQVTFGDVVFAFKDITLQWNDTIYSLTSTIVNFLSINNINFGVNNKSQGGGRGVFHIYLNNEIVGTINYED